MAYDATTVVLGLEVRVLRGAARAASERRASEGDERVQGWRDR